MTVSPARILAPYAPACSASAGTISQGRNTASGTAKPCTTLASAGSRAVTSAADSGWHGMSACSQAVANISLKSVGSSVICTNRPPVSARA
jgi:hypothetical protein